MYIKVLNDLGATQRDAFSAVDSTTRRDVAHGNYGRAATTVPGARRDPRPGSAGGARRTQQTQVIATSKVT